MSQQGLPRGCGGKLGYPTRNDADRAMVALKRRRQGHHAAALKVYHCPVCQLFHFGNDPKRRGPERRASFDKGSKLRRYWQLVRGEQD